MTKNVGYAIKASERLTEIGCQVVACITILDRQEGGLDAFNQAGVPLIPLLLRSDITGE